jgi:hypothetical protein
VACHPVLVLCNVPRAQKDALEYADSASDKHCAHHAILFETLIHFEELRVTRRNGTLWGNLIRSVLVLCTKVRIKKAGATYY